MLVILILTSVNLPENNQRETYLKCEWSKIMKALEMIVTNNKIESQREILLRKVQGIACHSEAIW
jgi:thermostable 8-oxoguanine DNA glycosylase